MFLTDLSYITGWTVVQAMC